MDTRVLVWSPAVRNKLACFRSERFSPEETFDFISRFVLETEAILSNPFLGKAYTVYRIVLYRDKENLLRAV
jgi:hypothetical protein